MPNQHIQSTSLIGPVEEKTADCGCFTHQSPPTCRRTLAQRLRPYLAVLALTVCTFLAAGRSPTFIAGSTDMLAADSNRHIQKADIIDEIIEIIEQIIGPLGGGSGDGGTQDP